MSSRMRFVALVGVIGVIGAGCSSPEERQASGPAPRRAESALSVSTHQTRADGSSPKVGARRAGHSTSSDQQDRNDDKSRASISAPSTSRRGAVAELNVAFEVTNTNTSVIPCASDSLSHVVRGHLVAPRSTLRTNPATTVTLYVHGFVVTETSWRFDAVPGYDHAAEMAKLGHVSITIERIGWDDGRPNGFMTCIGSAADVIHQIVGQLRSGDYAAEPNEPVAFRRVVLAGFETGGAVAQLEAYSYKDVDGLVVIGYHNQGITDGATQEFVSGASRCGKGGEDAESDTPGGGYIPATEAYIRDADFFDADAAVKAAVLKQTEKNPCGEFLSLLAEFKTGPSSLGQITVPVLLIQSDHDSVADPAGAEAQKDHYENSADVTFRMLKNTGHFPTLERTAPMFRELLSDWLASHAPGS